MFSRSGSLLPSIYADARSIDAVVGSQKETIIAALDKRMSEPEIDLPMDVAVVSWHPV